MQSSINSNLKKFRRALDLFCQNLWYPLSGEKRKLQSEKLEQKFFSSEDDVDKRSHVSEGSIIVSPSTLFLIPFSYLYRIIIYIRRILYRLGIFKVHKFSVPIIVVGNITVGGTGKTPLIIWLANFFKEKNYRVGIVTRGYKAQMQNYPHLINPAEPAALVGDEALLLSRRCQVPVVISPKRALGVTKLIAACGCNLILSDDGLQHYALARDIEIAVIDGSRFFGNGYCLPAGPLREPKSRLKEVDLVLIQNGLATNQQRFPTMEMVADFFYNLKNPKLRKNINNFNLQTVHAVAGIGNPEKFFLLLEQLGLKIIRHAFPDHHAFIPSDLNFGDNNPIILTEKDAVKCLHFAFEQCWILQISAKPSQIFTNKINDAITAAN